MLLLTVETSKLIRFAKAITSQRLHGPDGDSEVLAMLMYGAENQKSFTWLTGEDEVLGYAYAEHLQPNQLTSGVFLRTDMRGQGLAKKMLAMLVVHLDATLPSGQVAVSHDPRVARLYADVFGAKPDRFKLSARRSP